MKKVYVVSSVLNINVLDNWVMPDIVRIQKTFLNFDVAYNYCLNIISSITNYYPKEKDKIAQNSYILFKDEYRKYPIEVFYKDGVYRYWDIIKTVKYDFDGHAQNFLISEVDLDESEED